MQRKPARSTTFAYADSPYRVDNPQGRPCEATLIFSDQDFLPVSFGLQPMKSQPMECSGFQQAEISVPPEAPNGDVTVIWYGAANPILCYTTLIAVAGNVQEGAFKAVLDYQSRAVRPISMT